MRIGLYLLFVFVFTNCLCQNLPATKSWGLSVGPHFTNYGFKSGVGVSYPFNTTYSDRGTTNFLAQLSRSVGLSKHWELQTELTFTKYSATTEYHYTDAYPYPSKVLFDNRSSSFIGIGPAVSYRKTFGKRYTLNPFVGIAANLIVKSILKSQHEVNGSVQENYLNVRGQETSLFVNYDLGLRLGYHLDSRIAFELKPFYRHFLTTNYFFSTPGKRFYSFGVAFGVLLKHSPAR